MTDDKKFSTNFSPSFIRGLGTGVLITGLLFKIGPILVNQSPRVVLNTGIKASANPTVNQTQAIDKIASSILPDKLDLGVSFGDTIIKMVKAGAINKKKLLDIYSQRGGLTPEETSLLDSSTTNSIVITSQNANLILNLLWPLGIANKTTVLAEGPMGTTYKDEVGNFASTGGWTLGSQPGGQLYNQFSLISLTPSQEEKVKEISKNIYRPCCNNSTYFPDCNHGAAMLGFVELAVAQGMKDQDIYQKALVLNSFWFPGQYGDLAVYFQKEKGLSWDKIDPKEILSQTYSASQGYKVISQDLQGKGLVPQVAGGGGCGV